MAPTDPVLAASVRAYLVRDWTRFEQVRVQAHAAARRRRGIAESLRVVEQLRASAQALRPAWPTEADREADLEHHRQVAALLARTAPLAW